MVDVERGSIVVEFTVRNVKYGVGPRRMISRRSVDDQVSDPVVNEYYSS